MVLSLYCGLLGTGRAQQAAEAVNLRSLVEARQPDILLIGEMHDAQRQHALRLRWLEGLHTDAPSWRITLAMEQFDTDRQADIDNFLRQLSPAERELPQTARKLAQAAGFSFEGWDWTLYEPVVHLALKAGWPVVASNLSTAKASAIARGGPSELPAPLISSWQVADQEALMQEIRAGHCNALPERVLPAMSRAQRARDAQMAMALLSQAAPSPARDPAGPPAQRRLTVFLAGNGHVRKDLGVPRYLAALQPGVRSFSIGLLETGDMQGAVHDLVIYTAPQQRPDPCLAFGKR